MGMILKAWERCRSLKAGSGNKRSPLKTTSKSLSENYEKGQIAPVGCFSVYVGPHRQRFVVKTEFVNHPLFKALLEEAELEYGFKSDGPIWLPCNVDLFYKVLGEMACEDDHVITRAKGLSSFVLRSPARLFCYINRDHSAYSVVDSEMLKINQFL
ncbi:auxin-responsive protein SAUR72-like [Gastrolobium bilobum]|uniref:auxin-responsive protein SAUR72-like n=1 Tax=Gastrolobium bilobum TaxID=150636 RepID=UPI002AB1D58D|nr:auxin-responsive protein SAUR72-like [Gastrolobium bilobum]